jgi:predicted DNA-binding helix-hairpin-helix protein
MGFIRQRIEQSKGEHALVRSTPRFVPAGQSTQMIVGATGENDLKILSLTEGLYQNYKLKRVFFSAYIPAVENTLLPSIDTKPPLLREHRLYQADWLLRFYGFTASELLDEQNPQFNPYIDPKCNWALHHPEQFPVEVNRAPYQTLLRVPGIGVRSAQRIVAARRTGNLDFAGLKRLGVVLKRAQYFLTCTGKRPSGLDTAQDTLLLSLLSEQARGRMAQALGNETCRPRQLSLFDQPIFAQEELQKCLTGEL